MACWVVMQVVCTLDKGLVGDLWDMAQHTGECFMETIYRTLWSDLFVAMSASGDLLQLQLRHSMATSI